MGPLTSKTYPTVWGTIRGKVTLCLSQDDNKNNKIDQWTFVLKKKNNKKKKKKEHTHINQCLEKSIVIILQEMVCRLQ